MNKKCFTVVTLGCKVNQFESEAIEEALQEKGWKPVPFGSGVDLTVINTCVVTGRAEADSRRWIGRTKRLNPRGLLLVVGCYPQIDPQGVSALGPDGVVGNQEKEEIADIVDELLQARKQIIRVGNIREASNPPALQTPCFRHHTRAFVKIQDGCDAHCSYCVVPLARGKSRSVRPAVVIASLEHLNRDGYREVVLTGVHLGAYGRDLTPKTNLLDLLYQIEKAETSGRIRLSSIEPPEVTSQLVDLISASAKLCDHLHIPLQSGANSILRRMNRPYTAEFFRNVVLHVADQIPHAAIGVDVMVGFPGEDDEAFNQTYSLLQELPVSYLHVFPYSPRPHTKAGSMSPQIEPKKKRERVHLLRQLSRDKRRAFYAKYVQMNLPVLIEHRRERGMLRGLSRNYIFCLVQGENSLMGEEVNVRLLGLEDERAMGRLARRP